MLIRIAAGVGALGLATTLAACGKKSDSGTSETPAAQPAVGSVTPAVASPATPVDPMPAVETAEYRPPHIDADGNLADSPASLPLPTTLRTDLDPATFNLTYHYEEGRAAQTLVPPVGKFVVPQDGASITLPACDFPIPAPTMAHDLAWKVDGDLADWQGQGRVAVDRAGDGAGGAKDRDVIALWMGEDAERYYVFVETPGDFRASDPQLTPLVLEFMNLTPGSDDAKVNFAHARWMRLTASGWYEFGPAGNARLSSFTEVETAFSEHGVELAIRKDDPLLGTLREPWGLHAKFAGDHVFPPTDVVQSPVWGMIADYACLVPMPLSPPKMITMQRGANLSAELAEVAYRAAIASLPAVEYVIDHPFDMWDSYAVLLPDAQTAGGGVETSFGIAIGQGNVSGAARGNNVGVMEVISHEFTHGYNTTWWNIGLGWLGEGHGDFVRTLVDRVFYGPLVGHQRTLATRAFFRDFEAKNSLVALDDFNYTQNGNYVYAKAATFLERLTDGGLSFADLNAALLAPAANGEDPPAGSQAWLDRLAAMPSFVGNGKAGLWGGWIFGSSYADALFPLPPETWSSAATAGDGISDAFKRAAGLDPAVAVADADRRIVADNSLQDWELLHPASLLTPDPTRASKKATSNCAAGSHIIRYGARTDGDYVIVGLEFDGPRPTVETFSMALFFALPDDTRLTLTTYPSGRGAGIFGFRDGKGLRMATMFEPYSGPTLELFYHRAWAGFENGFPTGTKITNLDVYVGAERCDGLTNIAVEQP